MPYNETPFYAEAELLDRYIDSSSPEKDPDELNKIIQLLKTRPDLRDYFFRGSPHASWAKILWEHGFFSDPPSYQETEHGQVIPFWDVQGYLISVADQIPDIVLKHIDTIHGHPLYISRAIEALNFIPIDDAEHAVPKIIEWLEDPSIAAHISSPTYEFTKRLCQGSKFDSSFNLFHSLIAPVPSSKTKKYGDFLVGAEANSKFRDSYIAKKVLYEIPNILVEKNAKKTANILEKHLINTLELEANTKESPEYEYSSYWRVAIEETGQDSDYEYKHNLLDALRGALATWVDNNPKDAEFVIERYLVDKHEILRRLGLHILNRFPKDYKKYVVRELGNKNNLDDISIHHEFFLLLQYGYSYLDLNDQTNLIGAICEGPNKGKAAELAKFVQENRGIDPEEFLKHHSKIWIRDRLWMIKDNLSGQPLQILRA